MERRSGACVECWGPGGLQSSVIKHTIGSSCKNHAKNVPVVQTLTGGLGSLLLEPESIGEVRKQGGGGVGGGSETDAKRFLSTRSTH